MIKTFFNDKEFFKTFVKLAIPIALQNLVASSLNMVDTVMVGQLGETEIAAVGLANQFFFLLNLLMFGIVSGSAIYTSQYWGKRDLPNLRRVLGLSLMLSISAAFIFTCVSLLLPSQVIRIFSEDARVIELGSQFLRIVGLSYMITAVTFSFSFVLRSTGQAKLPMRISVMALLINTALNYLLITGKFGFPALGVRGSAIATVIARTIEVTVLLTIIYKNQYPVAAKLHEMMDLSKEFVGRFLNTTIPVILNESFWSLGVTMYSVAYGRMGTDVVASINIASTVERLAMVLFVGMGNACAVMVGNQIGAGQEGKAFDYAKKFLITGPFIGIFMGIALILSSKGILSVYNVSSGVYEAAARVLFVIALAMPVKIYNMIMIVGVLRSGGDTKFSLIIDTIGVWFIAVPLAFLGGLVWKLPVHWVYTFIIAEEVFKFTLGVRRFVTKKWINNLVAHA